MLDSAGSPPGQILVQAFCAGKPVPEKVYLAVSAPPSPPPASRPLCTLPFDRDKKRPVRVGNEALACLDEAALSLAREASFRLVITGVVNLPGIKGSQLASQRAVNAKAYLVEDKGIDSARILVMQQPGDRPVVQMYVLPAGAALDTSAGAVPVDEKKVKPQPRRVAR